MASIKNLTGFSTEELKLLALLGTGAFLLASSLSSINIALPEIQRQFDISLSALKWVSIIGAIMVASLSLCFGRAGDLLGRKRVYRTGILVYAIGAGLSATALSFPHLMVFRVMMATGLAMATPLSAAIIAANAAPERRGQLIGAFLSCQAAGMLMGPSLGGFILDIANWRAIFLTNMTLALLLVVAQHFWLRGPEERRNERFDLLGAILLVIGYPALLIALSFGPSAGWLSSTTLFFFAIASLGLTSFILRELKYDQPLFQFRFFKQWSLVIAIVTLMIMGFVQNPVMLFSPLYLQNVLGVSPFKVGLIMMALPLSTIVAGPIGGRLADRYQPKFVAAAGALVVLAAVVLYAQLGVTTAALLVIAPLVLVGFGSGMFRPANQVGIYHGADTREYGSLSALIASVGGLAGTLGTTITIAITETRAPGNEPADFTSAQQFTFLTLVPLLIFAAVLALLSKSIMWPGATPDEEAPVKASESKN